MNQEKELLEKVKDDVSQRRGYKSFRELDNDIFRPFEEEKISFSDEVALCYANELLKLRLGEIRGIMPSIACRHLIDKTLKDL